MFPGGRSEEGQRGECTQVHDLSGPCPLRSPGNKKTLQSGEGGIRTLDTLASTPDFESGAFSRSATSPSPVSLWHELFVGLRFCSGHALKCTPLTKASPASTSCQIETGLFFKTKIKPVWAASMRKQSSCLLQRALFWRKAKKNSFNTFAQGSSRTPAVTSTWWLCLASSSRL